MQPSNGDAKHPLSRLVGRFGQAHGQYLFGEYCLLVTLGPEAFRARHTAEQLTRLALDLGALGLWPAEAPPGSPSEAAGDASPVGTEALGPLDWVAHSLTQPPLQLRLGADLFRAMLDWAGVASEATGEPVAPGAWFDPSRAALTESLGFPPPPLAIALEAELDGHCYRLCAHGEAIAEGCAYIGQDLAIAPAEAPPASCYPWEADPNGEGLVAWWPIGPGAEPPEGCARVHWIVAVDRHLTAALRARADALVSVSLTAWLLNEAEAAGYDHELERYVSVPELRLAFRTLARQGLPLKPLPVLLEAMLQRILRRMAERPLTPIETEKLHRQLPIFPTDWLVGAARAGLGLPETPPPRFRFAAPAAPAPTPPARPDAERQARLLALARLAASERAAAAALAAVLRETGDRRAHALGPALRWSELSPVPPSPQAQPASRSPLVLSAAWRQRAGRALDAWVRCDRLLGALAAWLAAGASSPLSAEALEALAAPDEASWRWQLAEPARLLDEALAALPAPIGS